MTDVLPRAERSKDFPCSLFSKSKDAVKVGDDYNISTDLIANSEEKHGFEVFQVTCNDDSELEAAKKAGFVSLEKLVKAKKSA